MQAKTHDYGDNKFVQRLSLKRFSPVIQYGTTQETEKPYRTAHSKIIHVPGFKFGLAFGTWEETGYDEDEALLAAVEGVWMKSLYYSPDDEAIGAIIHKYSLNEDEEDRFKAMLGVYKDAKFQAQVSHIRTEDSEETGQAVNQRNP